MSLWSAIPAWVAGNAVPAADLNAYIKANLEHLHDNMPSCRVYNSVNISIANNTDTALTFDSERWDSELMHSVSSNQGRITIVTPGKYLVIAQVDWATGTGTNPRKVWIRKNGTTVVGQGLQPNESSGGVATQNVVTLVNLVAGDYLEVLVRQTSGGALNVLASADFSPEFMAMKVS
jgi:hypothetical protein